VIPVVHCKAVPGQSQGKLLVLQDLPIGLTQDGNQHLALEHRLGRIPINVKKHCVRRARAVFQDVHPPGVIGADGHVVGNDIQKQAHVPGFELADQIVKGLFGADLRVELQGVGHRVAVQAALAGLEQRRSIDVAHPQLMEINHQRPGLGKAETVVELQSISGAGNSGNLHETGLCHVKGGRGP